MLLYKVLVTQVTVSNSVYLERCTQIGMGSEEDIQKILETGEVSYQRIIDKFGFVDQEKEDCCV